MRIANQVNGNRLWYSLAETDSNFGFRMNECREMNTNEIVKGTLGSAAGVGAMITGWIAALEPALRVASLFAGLVLTCIMIRYWWVKTAHMKKRKP